MSGAALSLEEEGTKQPCLELPNTKRQWVEVQPHLGIHRSTLMPQQAGASWLPWHQHHVGLAGCSSCCFTSNRRAPPAALAAASCPCSGLPGVHGSCSTPQLLGDSHLAPLSPQSPPGKPGLGWEAHRVPWLSSQPAFLFPFDALHATSGRFLSLSGHRLLLLCLVHLNPSFCKMVSYAQSRGRLSGGYRQR